MGVDKQLIQSEGSAYWSFCVSYLDETTGGSKERVDYRQLLEPDAFNRFARMRELRKKIAQEDGVPAFGIFTDAELAALAEFETLDREKMLSVKGIGEKKVEKYGQYFMNL